MLEFAISAYHHSVFIAMALSRRLVGLPACLCQCYPKTLSLVPLRTLSTYRPPNKATALTLSPQHDRQWKRTFTASVQRGITGEEAPSAQAYISSGVLARGKDLIDVKKVLVIGSGGLSIGQAGEFDYSGWFSLSPFVLLLCWLERLARPTFLSSK